MEVKDYFSKFKKFISMKIEKRKNYLNGNGLIRLNHLQKMHVDKDGCGSVIHTYGKVYEMPKNMSCEQAFKIISFLKDKVATDLNLNLNELKTMMFLNNLLEHFHFTKISTDKYCEDEVVDLVISSEDIKFPKEDAIALEDIYWYTTDITQRQVETIYANRKESIDLSPLTEHSISALGTFVDVVSMKTPKTM